MTKQQRKGAALGLMRAQGYWLVTGAPGSHHAWLKQDHDAPFIEDGERILLTRAAPRELGGVTSPGLKGVELAGMERAFGANIRGEGQSVEQIVVTVMQARNLPTQMNAAIVQFIQDQLGALGTSRLFDRRNELEGRCAGRSAQSFLFRERSQRLTT